MDRIDEFRKLLKSLIAYQLIRGNNKPLPKENEFGVLTTIGEDELITNRDKLVEGKEIAHRSTIALIQFDFYSDNQLKAKQMAQDMIDMLTFKSRNMLLNKGYGIKDDVVSLQDRTFINNVEYIYRYGFDINIAFTRTIEREPATRIDTINIKANNEDIEIGG